MQEVEGESFTLRVEAIGALLPLIISGRFMYIHTHFGRGIEETEFVIVALGPGWPGHLGSICLYSPSCTPQTKVQAAAQELVLEMAPQ